MVVDVEYFLAYDPVTKTLFGASIENGVKKNQMRDEDLLGLGVLLVLALALLVVVVVLLNYFAR